VPARFDFTAELPVAGTGLVNGFTGWDGRAVIDWPEWEARLTMTASPALRHLVIYSPPGEPCVCIEPVSHSVDAFNLAAQGVPDTGTVVLRSGEALRGEVRFTPFQH
jgi:aldose 1-epimerase